MSARLGIGAAAWKGAVAGMAGGVALLAAREIEERGLLAAEQTAGARKSARRVGPAIRKKVRQTARARGVRLSVRESAAVDVALHLAGAAAVGAVYGIVRSRVRLPGPVDGPLLGALVYGASMWGVLPAAGLFARPARLDLRELLAPVGPNATFGMVTARAFGWLADDD